MPPSLANVPIGLRHMVLSTVFFSVMSVLAKIAGQHLPTMELVWARVVVTVVLSVWVLRHAGVSLLGNNRKLLLLRGFFGFAGLSCYFYAITHLPLADAVVIQFTNPVLTAVLAAVFLKEHLSGLDVVVTVASLVGVVLVAQPTFLFAGGRALDPVAVCVAFAGAIFAAAAYVTVRKLGATEHPLVVVLYFALVTGPLSLPIVAVEGLVWPTPIEWLLLLGIGVMAQLGQVAMTKGYAMERAGRASAVTYLQIVFAYGWGIALFGEYPNALSVAGAALVVLSVASVIRRGY